MHIEHIHFEEVFDVQTGRGDFSFRMKGHPCYGANLGSGVIPRAGARYVVMFGKQGDWSSLIAWRDLASDKVWFRKRAGIGQLLELGDLALSGPPLIIIVIGLVLAGQWLPAFGFGALLCFAAAAFTMRNARRKRAIENILLSTG